MRTKLRKVRTGQVIEKTFRSGERVEPADELAAQEDERHRVLLGLVRQPHELVGEPGVLGDHPLELLEAGLPPELATRLARETVAGSGELLHRSDVPSATLRQNVTSPGGTTAAALDVLMGPDGMQSLLTRAVAAATRRSKELAK